MPKSINVTSIIADMLFNTPILSPFIYAIWKAFQHMRLMAVLTRNRIQVWKASFYLPFIYSSYVRTMETPLEHVLNSFADVRPEHLAPMLLMLVLVVGMTWYKRRYIASFRITWRRDTGWTHQLLRFPTHPSAETLSKIQRKLKLSNIEMENLVRQKMGDRV